MFQKLFIIPLLLFFIACNSESPLPVANYEIVPMVQNVKETQGTPFVLDKSTKIYYPKENRKLAKTAELLSEYISTITPLSLEITNDPNEKQLIKLTTDYASDNKEAYIININVEEILINGASEAGVFYGIQTLRKSIPVTENNKIEFPCAELSDYPAYKHRGVSLDVSRHFFSVEFVKKYIDILALCNMNVLHWHLTDDQGWRIEIKKYPKLTEIGSKREKTIIGRHTGEYDNKPVSGYYTQEEIKDIIKYAEERFITIIPEVDIPGHTLAVLASYPYLGCTGGPYQVGCEWGIYEDVLCAGNEEVFSFMEDVLDEVTSLFPSKYIHIGGDECLKNRWMECPKCQARMRQLNLKETPEHSLGEQLQSYFIRRIEKMVNKKGKSIIGWDEILEGGIAPNATIMSWRGTEGGIYAANKGHDVIMTPEQYVYLDYYQSPDVDNEPFTFGWLTELKKTYSFNPMPKDMDEDKQRHILGAQANIWAEYMPSAQNVEYMLLPRMCAVAETVWTNPGIKDYNDFVSRLYRFSKQFDKLGYENCKQAYQIEDSIIIDTEKNEVRIQLATFDNSPIYYTTGYNEPSSESTLYSSDQPIIIRESGSVKAVLYRDNQKGKVYTKDFYIHKAFAKPITLKYAPDKRYTFNGATTLVDGLYGASNSYRTGTWLGFSGTDFEADIDLTEMMNISSVSINFYINTRGGLFSPQSLSLLASEDGKTFTEIKKVVFDEPKEHISPKITTLSAEVDKSTPARYVRVVAESIKTLPHWHEKKGDKAFLMIDEVKID